MNVDVAVIEKGVSQTIWEYAMLDILHAEHAREIRGKLQ